MADTETVVAPPESAPPTTTTAPPTEASPSSSKWDKFELSTDQLKSAGFSDADIKEAAAESTPAATTLTTPAKTAPVEEKDADAVNLDFLKAPEPTPTTPPTAAPPTPALSTDQAAVLKFFPNADIAAMGAQGLMVTNAYSRGNVDEFLSSLQNINPAAFTHLQEQLYQRLMPNWVDRYIEENDPNGNPGQRALKQRLDTVERERAQERQNLAAWQQQQQQLEQQRQHQSRLQQIDNQLNSWLDQAKFTDRNGWTMKDRNYVLDAVRVALAGNQPMLDQTLGGNLGVLRNLVREKAQDYIDLDRARAQAQRDKQTKQQTDKKPPLQAAGVATTAPNQKSKDAYYEAAAAWARDHQTT